VSAYAIAEAMTAPLWGMVSDVYGRKPVALIGLLGVALSSLLFGVAQTYWVALLARFIGGALNGNVAIMQTMSQSRSRIRPTSVSKSRNTPSRMSI
jgi:MFS family permease